MTAGVNPFNGANNAQAYANLVKKADADNSGHVNVAELKAAAEKSKDKNEITAFKSLIKNFDKMKGGDQFLSSKDVLDFATLSDLGGDTSGRYTLDAADGFEAVKLKQAGRKKVSGD